MDKNPHKVEKSDFESIGSTSSTIRYNPDTKARVVAYNMMCYVRRNFKDRKIMAPFELSLEEWINILGKPLVVAHLGLFLDRDLNYSISPAQVLFAKNQKTIAVDVLKKLRVPQKSLSNFEKFKSEAFRNGTGIKPATDLGLMMQSKMVSADSSNTLPLKSRSRSRSKPLIVNMSDDAPAKQVHKSKPRGSQIGLKNHRP